MLRRFLLLTASALPRMGTRLVTVQSAVRGLPPVRAWFL
jgi:hypothetical protein